MVKSSNCQSCKLRSHGDYTISATCEYVNTICGSAQTLSPDVCLYCLSISANLAPAKEIEPFKSVYLKATISKPKDPAYFRPCSLRNGLVGSKYLCETHGTCTLEPLTLKVADCKNCQDSLIRTAAVAISPVQPRISKIENWAVAVITAPRTRNTIQKCIRSLELAGWDSGLVFSEPNQTIKSTSNWPVTYRASKIGIFGNFILGLYELFIRNIEADAFLIVQDDMVASLDLRQKLESWFWTTTEPHIISLFSPDAVDTEPGLGWSSSNFYRGGPNALVLSHETVQALLTSMIHFRYYAYAKTEESTFDDLGIFHWAKMHNFETLYCKPSLMHHIAAYSTHCTYQAGNWRYASSLVEQATTTELNIVKCSNGILSAIGDKPWSMVVYQDKCVVRQDTVEHLVNHFNYTSEWYNLFHGVSASGVILKNIDGPCAVWFGPTSQIPASIDRTVTKTQLTDLLYYDAQ